MNAIQLLNLCDMYLDSTRAARYQRIEYNNAFNDATLIIVDDVVRRFQQEQVLSDEVYTLMATQSAAPTGDVALVPSDYYFLTSLFATIGGTQYYCRPTTENKRGPTVNDTYRAPSDTKPYYKQQSTGFKILHGSGTVTSCELNYIKMPATYNCGKDSQLIDSGTGVISSGQVYVATEPSVHNATSYNIGDEFTAANNDLNSGQVILKGNTTTSDLPVKVHRKLAKLAASILSGAAQAYNPSAFAEKESQKP